MSSSIAGTRAVIRRKMFLNTFSLMKEVSNVTLLLKTFLATRVFLGFTFEASEVVGPATFQKLSRLV